MTKKRAIQSIERRADHLAKKIAEDNTGRPLHGEREELQALRIAIEELERAYELDMRRREMEAAG